MSSAPNPYPLVLTPVAAIQPQVFEVRELICATLKQRLYALIVHDDVGDVLLEALSTKP